MGNELCQIRLAPPIQAPAVRAWDESGTSKTAKRRGFEQTHITENETRATIGKELSLYSLSYRTGRLGALNQSNLTVL